MKTIENYHPPIPDNLSINIRARLKALVDALYFKESVDRETDAALVRCICRCGWLDIADAGKGMKSDFDAYENERKWKEWRP